MWSETPIERRSPRTCNNECGVALATPFGPATLPEAQADHAGSRGGCISIFKFCRNDKWKTWKAAVFCHTLVPTDDQWNVVERMHERLLVEKADDSKASQRKNQKEPLRSMIQGLPGAGNSWSLLSPPASAAPAPLVFKTFFKPKLRRPRALIVFQFYSCEKQMFGWFFLSRWVF